MSREIKFRAWDKKEKKMIYPTFITNDKKDDDYIYLQYTGLEDKNGIEIYEGDIVDFRHGERKLYIAFNLGQWSMCGCLNEPNKDYRNLDHYVNHDGPIEVIGNIYDNLDLLESEVEQ